MQIAICVYHNIRTHQKDQYEITLDACFLGSADKKTTQENSSDNLNALKNTKSPKKIKNTHTSATLFGG